MSKSKSDEVGHLKKHIKQLQKEIARNKKRGDRYPEPSKDVEPSEEAVATTKKAACPKCGGNLLSFGGSKVKVFICDSCAYRSTKRGG